MFLNQLYWRMMIRAVVEHIMPSLHGESVSNNSRQLAWTLTYPAWKAATATAQSTTRSHCVRTCGLRPTTSLSQRGCMRFTQETSQAYTWICPSVSQCLQRLRSAVEFIHCTDKTQNCRWHEASCSNKVFISRQHFCSYSHAPCLSLSLCCESHFFFNQLNAWFWGMLQPP